MAEQVAAAFAHRASDARFTGEGVCYAEVGDGRAIQIRGRFLGDVPLIEITAPSEANVAGKVAFEADRLAAWFGS